MDKENYTEIVTETWVNCLFRVGFSQSIYKPSLIRLCQLVGAESKTINESSVACDLQISEDKRCLNTCEFLSLPKCSAILVLRRREVSPIYVALQAHVNLYITLDLRNIGILSFVLKASLF